MSYDIFDIPPHPAAAVFPMLDSDELRELADDIAANGLNHPLVVGTLDGNPVLIDGRNRRAACQIAGIVPEVVEFVGDDPAAFIVSENIARRHMTKGQRAIAVAMIYPEGEKGGRGNLSQNVKGFPNHNYLAQARAVLRHAPGLADSVLGGGVTLSDAYKQAQERKREAESEEARLETLKAEAPDLADMVIEGGAKLAEQWAAFEKRRADELEVRKNWAWTICAILEEVAVGVGKFGGNPPNIAEAMQDDIFRDAFEKRFPKGFPISEDAFFVKAQEFAEVIRSIGGIQK